MRKKGFFVGAAAVLGGLALMSAGLCAASAETAKPRPLTKTLVIDKAENIDVSGGIIRIPGRYRQGKGGEVVIEAEEPTSFIAEDESDALKTFRGRDSNASEGRYVAYLKSGEYDIQIDSPRKLRLWYRAYFTVGSWTHNEQLDNGRQGGQERGGVDSNEQDASSPNINKWTWKKGQVYDFGAGRHSFALDWLAGAKLDQLAFLPEGVEPRNDGTLPATFAERPGSGEAVSCPVIVRKNQRIRRLNMGADRAGGELAAYFSEDQGKSWKAAPENGDLSRFALRGEKELRFKFALRLSPRNASPVVSPGTLSGVSSADASLLSGVPADMLQAKQDVALFPASWSGLRADGEGWRLANEAAPDGGAVVWLDAANADQTLFAPPQGSWTQEDSSAFSGKAVYQAGHSNNNLLSFDVRLPGAATLRPWFRVKLNRADIHEQGDLGTASAYYPMVGHQFDNDEVALTDYGADKKAFPLAAFQKHEWIWVPGKAAPLKGGHHVFRFRKGFEYCLLDRIALVGVDAPAPAGKGGAPRKAAATDAEMRFHAVNTVALQDIAELKVEGSLAGARVEHEYSLDGGKTFKPFSASAVEGERRDQAAFIFKTIVHAGQDAAGFRLKGASARLAAPGKTVVALANAGQKILFDGETGQLAGWWGRDSGWIMPEGYLQAYFRFAVGAKGKFSAVSQSDAELVEVKAAASGGTKTLQLKYSLFNDAIAALVKVELPEAGLAKWSLRLSNGSKQDIRGVTFPALAGLRVGDDPENNWGLSFLYIAGGAVPCFPAAPLRTVGFSTAAVYPGWQCMGWLALGDGRESFTAQVRDTDTVGTFIGLGVDPECVASTMTFRRLMTISPGEARDCDYALGCHAGDWHRSADFYGAWAHSWMDFSHVNANWAKDADGWVAGWHFASTSLASRYLTHLVPELQWLGAGYFQHFHNCIDGTCSSATLHVLNPRYGSLADFRKAHVASAAQGVRHTYYTPSRIFTDLHAVNDTIGSTPRELLPPEIKLPPPGFGAKWGAKDAAGQLVGGTWDNPPTWCTHLCPSSQGGHDELVEGIATNYCKLAGAQGVYSDEACGFTECYDTSHGHGKQYGLWAKGLMDDYKESLETARKRDPDVVLAMEGSADQLLQYVDFPLEGSASSLLTLYTFPEAKLIGPVSNKYGSFEENTRFSHLYLRLNRMGFSYECGNDRKFFAHRKRVKDWMYGRRFMDDCGLSVSRPGIVAKWFQRDDADHAGALVNIQNEFAFAGATVTVASPPLADAGFALGFLLEEEEIVKLPCERLAGGVRVPVPSAKASSILIPARVPERESLQAWLVWPQEPGRDKLVLYVANFGKEPKDVALSYTLPAGVSPGNPPATLTVPPMDLKRVEIPLDGVGKLKAMAKASVALTAGPLSASCDTLLAPTLSNGGFETDSAGKGTPDGWRAMGANWFTHLLQNLTLPFELGHTDGTLDPDNPAEGKFSLRLDGKTPLRVYWLNGATMWAKELRGKREQTGKMGYWRFNTGSHLILKPGTRYKVSFKFRTASDDGAIVVRDFPYWDRPLPFLHKVSAPKGDRSWQSYEFQFDMPRERSECLLLFYNESERPVWLDDVRVDEVSGGAVLHHEK